MARRILIQNVERLARELGIDIHVVYGDRRRGGNNIWQQRANDLQERIVQREEAQRREVEQRAEAERQARRAERIQAVVPDAVLIRNAFGGHGRDYRINNTTPRGNPIINADLRTYLTQVYPKVEACLIQVMGELGSIKSNLSVYVLLTKGQVDENGEQVVEMFYLQSKVSAIMNVGEINAKVLDAMNQLFGNLGAVYLRGSGWQFVSVQSLDIGVSRFRPRGGGSYVTLPKFISATKSCVNPKNTDNKCFMWSILASLHEPANHPERINHYRQFENELNFNGIDFPVKHDTNDIDRFEEQNGIAVHVLAHDNKIVTHVRISKLPRNRAKDGLEPPRIVVLLLSGGHYVWVKNVSRLLGKQITQREEHQHVCLNCLCFSHADVAKLKQHEECCLKNDAVAVIMPKPGDKVQYGLAHHLRMKIKMPFTIYCDAECYTVPVAEDDPVNQHAGKTLQEQRHVPCSLKLYVVTDYDVEEFRPQQFDGPNCVAEFVTAIIRLSKHLYLDYIKRDVNPDRIFPAEDEAAFAVATHCHICEAAFDEGEGADRVKVRDHDHINGRYRGAAHKDCNRTFNLDKQAIPVFFHNLKGYDSHLIIAELGRQCSNLKVIPQSGTKYISFGTEYLRFMDSMQFMVGSLETHVSNLATPDKLPKGVEVAPNDPTRKRSYRFKHLKKHITHRFDGQRLGDGAIELLTMKGIFPYDWHDGPDKWNVVELPPKQAFYSKLSGEAIKDEDYERASTVWREFGCRTFKDYHDLYLTCDVLQLADVFEHWRSITIADSGIDPCWSYTLPGFSQVSMLKKTGAKIGLMSDISMHNMVASGIRGGMSTISHRYAKANNPLIPGYDPSKPKTWIINVDANSLYPTAMVDYLPNDGGEWVDPRTITVEFIMSLLDDGEYCYILKVRLKYPKHLHDDHNLYPLAPENKVITPDKYSKYSADTTRELDLKGAPTVKLVGTLEDKDGYVIHSRNLKYYLSKGLVLDEVYSAIRFKQSKFMEPYITYHVRKRAAAQNKTETQFHKDCMTSVYGKQIEDVRGHMDMKLIGCGEERVLPKLQRRFQKLVSSPHFHRNVIIDENSLVAVHMNKSKVVLNKPIQIGFAILEMSKLVMFKFYYDVIRARYGEKAILLFTDTDSLTLHIETENIYDDMKEMHQHFDFSNYGKTHPMFNEDNKAQLGKFKDETEGNPIAEFVGLRSKMYSLNIYDLEKKQFKKKSRAKGITTVAANGITHEDYLSCVMNHEAYRDENDKLIDSRRQNIMMRRIQARPNDVTTVTIDKVVLCAFDDKRYLREEVLNADGTVKYARGIASYAYGHKRIKMEAGIVDEEDEQIERAAEIAEIDHGGELVEVAPAAPPIVEQAPFIQRPVRPGNLLAI